MGPLHNSAMNDSAALEMLAYHEYAPRFVLAEPPLTKFFNGPGPRNFNNFEFRNSPCSAFFGIFHFGTVAKSPGCPPTHPVGVAYDSPGSYFDPGIEAIVGRGSIVYGDGGVGL